MNEPAHRPPDASAEPAATEPAPTPLLMRIFWYGVAGVVTIALNSALFAYFHDVRGWANYQAYAMSLGLLNLLKFPWSYFVGFRTREHWTVSARRQVAVLLVNYVLVIALQEFFPAFEKAVIVAVQVVIAVVKFVVYHYWVYPDRPVPATDRG